VSDGGGGHLDVRVEDEQGQVWIGLPPGDVDGSGVAEVRSGVDALDAARSDELRGAVRGGVVDDHDAEVDVRGGDLERLEQTREVGGAVVGHDDDGAGEDSLLRLRRAILCRHGRRTSVVPRHLTPPCLVHRTSCVDEGTVCAGRSMSEGRLLRQPLHQTDDVQGGGLRGRGR
jgi:hypothetical protein